MRTLAIAALLVSSIMLSATPAAWGWKADRPVGYVQLAEGQVYAASPKGLRRLEALTPLLLGDLVAVSPGGKAQIIFHDGGVLVMGASSFARVNEFEHAWGDASPKRNHMKAELGPGLFRYYGGGIQKKGPGGLRFKTPLGSLGPTGRSFGARVASGDEAGAFEQTLNSVFQSLAALNLDDEKPKQPEQAATLISLYEDSLQQRHFVQTHAHLKGFADQPMAFTDARGESHEVPPLKTLRVSESEARLLAEDNGFDLWSPLRIDPNAQTPGAYRIMLGEDWGVDSGSDASGSDCGC